MENFKHMQKHVMYYTKLARVHHSASIVTNSEPILFQLSQFICPHPIGLFWGKVLVSKCFLDMGLWDRFNFGGGGRTIFIMYFKDFDEIFSHFTFWEIDASIFLQSTSKVYYLISSANWALAICQEEYLTLLTQWWLRKSLVLK